MKIKTYCKLKDLRVSDTCDLLITKTKQTTWLTICGRGGVGSNVTLLLLLHSELPHSREISPLTVKGTRSPRSSMQLLAMLIVELIN